MQELVAARAVLRAAVAALAVAASAPAVSEITLGDVEVRSALGEALDARIPVTGAPGDPLRGACFTLSPDAASDLPAPLGATLELRRSASGTRLQVHTKEPVQDPALTLGVLIACPGSDAAAARKDYSILLDPPRVARAAPAAAPVATTSAIATLTAEPGDTLESLATKIFPRNGKARRAYLAAIRADNPALAGLADTDPLPADAKVALPDLRTFMKAAPAPRTEVAAAEPAAPRAEAPAPRPRARPRVAERAAAQPTPAPAPEALPSARAEAPDMAQAALPATSRSERAARPAAARAAVPRAAFQLKLSAPVVDLAPSRSMNESQRAALRARLMVLDSDDQTAAMLAMQDSIRRLETQVSELQLKLVGMPAAAAAMPAKAQPTPPPQAEPAPAKAEPAPPKTEAAAPKPEPATNAKSEPEAAPPPAPKAEPAPVKSEPPKVEVNAEPPAKAANAAAPSEPPPAPSTAAHAIPRPAHASAWYESQWMLPGVLAGLALLLALWLLVRRRAAGYEESAEEEYAPENDGQTVMIVDDAPAYREPLLPDDEVGTQPDVSVPAPLLATTRIPPEDNADLRRRYVEERFPEIVNGTLVLSDPVSVVNAARLMREDGAATRAIELLHLAIEKDPNAMAPWLALFQVFRLEGLRSEYASLAVRFMERYNGTLEWRKVRYVGRELDPGNPLYEDTEPALAFDPSAENWLQPGPGGGDAALAAELRGGLMAGAAVNEHDLVPDPTPALRKSESIDLA